MEADQLGPVMLELEEIHMNFGKVSALAGVSLQIRPGEIHSVIGPNGAGKTVMMNCINGLYHPQRAPLNFKGQQINHSNRMSVPNWAWPAPFRKSKYSAA